MKQNNKLLLGCCAVAAAALPVFLAAPGKASARQKAPFYGRNIAHRGLHARDKSIPENSMEAFSLAVEMGYGIELDVQLSKDGAVVVFHDDTLDRVCGVHGRVEDYTFAELRKMKLCGTECRIPLFSDVLQLVNGRRPIICELKNGKRNRELCRKTYDLISAYRGEICVESFSPLIVGWFRIHAKDLLRGQLAMPAHEYPEDTPGGKVFAFLASRTLLNFISRPQFIAYQLGYQPPAVRLAQVLGAMKVAWTSHEPRNEKGKDCVIFEYYKPKQIFKEE
ncbi:MAG: glycerophosphodiester phosphodiesterase [Oscillospiraceae bacterium]|nr:glycerophosphodiester phosphodiesterase [Oscillospiraceae bacterium]